MHFPAADRSGDVVVRAQEISKAYQRPLFEDVSFDMLRGERWGILGPNGCGKTTLVRCLLGEEPLSGGTLGLGHGVIPAYFDQQLQGVNAEASVVDAIRSRHADQDEPARRKLLARFGLTGEIVFERVGRLSGGERTRAALARLAGERGNLLILDEPTNHLDLWARQSLEAALRDYDGTILLITHDRYLLDQVADHLLVFEPGRVAVFPGCFSEYQQSRAVSPAGLLPGERDTTATRQPSTTPPPRPDKPPRQKRRFPYRKLADIEADIARHEARVEEIHAGLTRPEVLRDGAAVKHHQSELRETEQALAMLYEHWEEAAEREGA